MASVNWNYIIGVTLVILGVIYFRKLVIEAWREEKMGYLKVKGLFAALCVITIGIVLLAGKIVWI